MLLEASRTAHALFAENYIPRRPFASNTVNTLKAVTPEQALTKRFLTTQGSSSYKNLMIFDVDSPDADYLIKSKAYDDKVILPPNIITINPASQHAHAIYILDSAVGTDKGVAFFNHVRRHLNQAIGGDTAYAGNVTRNPAFHPSIVLTDVKYNLADLNALYDRLPLQVKQETQRQARALRLEGDFLGRNDLLFEVLRKYAYKKYVELKFNKSAFSSDLKAHAESLYENIEDKAGFSKKELQGIVKSIYNFTIKNFTSQDFSRIQASRANIRWQATAEDREERNSRILHMLDSGVKVGVIADLLEIPRGTVSAVIRRSKA